MVQTGVPNLGCWFAHYGLLLLWWIGCISAFSHFWVKLIFWARFRSSGYNGAAPAPGVTPLPSILLSSTERGRAREISDRYNEHIFLTKNWERRLFQKVKWRRERVRQWGAFADLVDYNSQLNIPHGGRRGKNILLILITNYQLTFWLLSGHHNFPQL